MGFTQALTIFMTTLWLFIIAHIYMSIIQKIHHLIFNHFCYDCPNANSNIMEIEVDPKSPEYFEQLQERLALMKSTWQCCKLYESKSEEPHHKLFCWAARLIRSHRNFCELIHDKFTKK